MVFNLFLVLIMYWKCIENDYATSVGILLSGDSSINKVGSATARPRQK